jgi:hypothetical protein
MVVEELCAPIEIRSSVPSFPATSSFRPSIAHDPVRLGMA